MLGYAIEPLTQPTSLRSLSNRALKQAHINHRPSPAFFANPR
jgi:hypothetical protein